MSSAVLVWRRGRPAAGRRAPGAGQRPVAIAPGLRADRGPRRGRTGRFAPSTRNRRRRAGWAKYNRHYWLARLRRTSRLLLSEMFPEPHSTKQIEDGIGWALETDPPRSILRGMDAGVADDAETALRLCARVRCPVLVIHGTDDPSAAGRGSGWPRHHRRRGWSLLEGAGHGPHLRDPVRDQPRHPRLRRRCPHRPPARAWRRGRARRQAGAVRLVADRPRPRPARRRHRPRAAHAAPRPGDRLAGPGPGDPRARGPRRADPPGRAVPGQRVAATSRPSRPSTTCTASRRSGGWTRSCVANFMVFETSCARSDYDLWIGDEAWEVDYFLHENPELKRAAVRLADRLRRLAADARRRRARGVPDRRLQRRDDRAHRALPAASATGRSSSATRTTSCPDAVRARACRPSASGPRQHFDFAGYVTGFDPRQLADREALRAELGYRPDEQVCIVTVGGSGVGERACCAG